MLHFRLFVIFVMIPCTKSLLADHFREYVFPVIFIFKYDPNDYMTHIEVEVIELRIQEKRVLATCLRVVATQIMLHACEVQ